MAARTAVIASRIGGIPELVRHGSTGYLFDPGDANGLALSMKSFLDNPEQVRRFGDAGYEAIRVVSLEIQMQKLIRIYDGLVSD